ncbi:hypothetical protein GCM10009623_16670 [Nocardioides aestuarii]|uniref:FAD-dependent oxidoreductase n=1 Tax=Nocardioides aestuarii TaxID=252231 RepID=A0ABW4TK56_9ACTN
MAGAAPRRVAVVGSGVAGLVAAYVAARSAEVTLYEADDRLGGHADTHEVADRGQSLAIDTGFIVHNRRTYPTLLRLFAELGVETQQSEMSLSVSDDETGLEWAGALGPRGLFPVAANLRRPAYLRMLTEIPKFHRQAKALLDSGGDGSPEQTLREFLREGGFSAYFERHFMEPVVAAVWSTEPERALEFPARYLFTFLQHHGMLSVFGSPTWRTVTGGSREYVERVAASLPDVRTGTKVTSVVETATGVEVTDGNGRVDAFDACVIAAHPDQALAMLAEPTPLQRELLEALPYSPNSALLHTDTSLLPGAEGARASWNFRRVAGKSGEVTVTYDLTRLQRLDTDTHYLVTLGGDDLVDPDTVIARRDYAHPLYTPESVAARERLPEISTDRLAFAGAYHGWGFHEDGARSGLAAAERIGLSWDSEPTHEVEANRVYATTITHTRRRPWRRTFTHRSRTWLVDVDDLPDHGPFAVVRGSFEARDHLGDADRTIRENVDAFLASEGVSLDGGRVLMAAMPRALGYCFNPISVFWCFGPGGDRRAVVVEVHNTYGDRHAYLVHPDPQGRARTDKQMYVSPFHGTGGHYELAVPVPGERLDVMVTLVTDDDVDGDARFSASLRGEATTERGWRAAPAALRSSLLIRLHGVWLWLRRLPVRPRPAHHQEGVSPR